MRELRAKTSSHGQKHQQSQKQPPIASSRRRKSSAQEMNNAENFASVEIKRKVVAGEAPYEFAERGEGKLRGFVKPDKPASDDDKHRADSLTSLPGRDLRNFGLLMLLCMLQYLERF